MRKKKEEKYKMTDEQRAFVFAAGEKIRQLPGGEDYKVYCAISIGRLQYTKNDKHFRMFCVLEDEGEKEITDKILKLYEEIQKKVKAERNKP